jgi:hypothetical protein
VSTELVNVKPAPIQSVALKLTIRQKSLVDNLLECKDRWKAAELAGYTGNRTTLSQTAYETLKLPHVQAYYAERLQAMHCSGDEVLAEIGEIARAPWEKFIDIKHSESGEVIPSILKLSDKLKALELAGKAHALFVEKTETNLSDSAGEKIAEQFFNLLQQAAQRRAEESIEVKEVSELPPVTLTVTDT